MNAVPATAPNALQAMVHREMFVGNTPVTPQTLRAAADQSIAEGWADAFVLDVDNPGARVAPDDIRSLVDSSVSLAYLVRNVRVATVTFGYKAGAAASHSQSPVAPEDRLAQFFSDPEGLTRFRAFVHTTEGAALVLQLDPQQIVGRLALPVAEMDELALEQVIERESHEIARREVRDLLGDEGVQRRLPTYRSLHAVEHAFLLAAMRQLGTDAIGSRLFPRSATIVLFEQARVGRGGVVQLVNRGPGLVQLVHAARDLMLGCAQGCTDGCPACVYLRDQHCSHPLDELGAAWLPANALLSRAGAAAILSEESGH